jgi:hypothetical protein
VNGGADLIIAAFITELGALLAVLLTWKLKNRSTAVSTVDAAVQMRDDFEKLTTQREAERERERDDLKIEIQRSRTDLARSQAEADRLQVENATLRTENSELRNQLPRRRAT